MEKVQRKDKIKILGKRFKVLKDFVLKDMIIEFNSVNTYIEGRMTAFSSSVFLDNLTDFLLANHYVEPYVEKTSSFDLDCSINGGVGTVLLSSLNHDKVEVDLDVRLAKENLYTSDYHWSVR